MTVNSFFTLKQLSECRVQPFIKHFSSEKLHGQLYSNLKLSETLNATRPPEVFSKHFRYLLTSFHRGDIILSTSEAMSSNSSIVCGKLWWDVTVCPSVWGITDAVFQARAASPSPVSMSETFWLTSVILVFEGRAIVVTNWIFLDHRRCCWMSDKDLSTEFFFLFRYLRPSVMRPVWNSLWQIWQHRRWIVSYPFIGHDVVRHKIGGGRGGRGRRVSVEKWGQWTGTYFLSKHVKSKAAAL